MFSCDLSFVALWAYCGEISKELSSVLTLLYFDSRVPQAIRREISVQTYELSMLRGFARRILAIHA